MPDNLIHEGDMDICRCDFDFVGLQHYSPIYFRPDNEVVLGVNFSQRPDDVEVTGIGWEIAPHAFRDCLIDLKETYGNKNWVITENGYADHDVITDRGEVPDEKRIDFLKRYLSALKDAMDSGVTVGGYFIWSFLDNFEWADGYHARFGLVHVDYDTLVRTPKKSLAWYKDFLDN
jgi:beta-glucosidase